MKLLLLCLLLASCAVYKGPRVCAQVIEVKKTLYGWRHVLRTEYGALDTINDTQKMELYHYYLIPKKVTYAVR